MDASRSDVAIACSEGDYDHAIELMTTGSNPVTSRTGYFNWSPLHYAAQHGQLEFAKLLILQYECHPQVEDKEGRTPLHIACQHGNLEFARYLIEQKRCNAEYLDIEEQTPLHHSCGWLSECIEEQALNISHFLVNDARCDPNRQDMNGKNGVLHACEKGFLSILRFFVEEHNCDLSVVDYKGNNALHLAVSFSNNLNVVNYIISKNVLDLESRNCKNNNVLHMAAIANSNLDICKVLLDLNKSCSLVDAKNEDNSTPLNLAKPDLFHLILTRCQVKDENFYDKYSLSLGIKETLNSQVKIFVVGDSNSEKNTLIRSLSKESSSFSSSFSLSFSSQSPSPSPTPSEEAQGLVVTFFESKFYGNVSFYDFSGNSCFECMQQAFLQHLVHPIFSLFIIVIDFSKSVEERNASLCHWLAFLSQPWSKMLEKPKVIIVGSHADQIKSSGKSTKKSFPLNSFESLYGSYEITAKIPLYCHKTDHSGTIALRRQLVSLCDQLKDKSVICFNASCLLTYINYSSSSSPIISVESLLSGIKSYSLEKGPIFDVRYFLSDDTVILTELIDILDNAGHILFLRNEDIKKSLIIADVSWLFSELSKIFINKATVLLNSQGLVNIATLFPDQDSNLVGQILTHFELCVGVATNKSELPQKLHYFPNILLNTAPKNVWDFNGQYDYNFGWNIECDTCEQCFSLRFIHTVLLRCFSVAMLISDSASYTFWENGFYFNAITDDSLELLIEASNDFKMVLVLMRSQKFNSFCLKYRSSITKEIRDVAMECCGYIKPIEQIMDPLDTKFYPECRKRSTMFDISEIAISILTSSSVVKSKDGKIVSLKKLLFLEPYEFIGPECVTLLSKSKRADSLTDNFFKLMANAIICNNFESLGDICSIFSIKEIQPDSDSLYSALLLWKENNNVLTFGNVTQWLDSYSLVKVFNL